MFVRVFGALCLSVLSAVPALAAPITLRVWALEEPTRITETLAREFEARDPDVRIEVRTVKLSNILNDTVHAVSTGTAPDVMMIDNPDIALIASHDVLLALDNMLDHSTVVRKQDFFPGPIAQATWNGHVYALPRGANTLALYYNADQFRAAGLDPDTPPRTWSELREAAAKLTAPNQGRWGITFSAVPTEEGTFQFLPWIQSAGADFNRLNDEGAVRALEFWVDLVESGLASPGVTGWTQNESTARFAAGQASMAISGPWELPALDRNAKFEWRVAELPAETSTSPRASALGEFAYAVPVASRHPEEAFRFMEYIYSQSARNWNEFGMLPPNVSAAPVDPKWPKAYAVFAEEMRHARGRGPHPAWPQISKAIQSAIQTALSGKNTARAALGAARAAVDRLIN